MQVQEIRVEVVFRPDDPSYTPWRVAEVRFSDGEPTVELELSGPADNLTCTGFTIRKTEGIVSRDLRFELNSLLEIVARHAGLTDRGRRQDLRPRRKRRVMTDDFLRRVADAYVRGGRTIAGVKAADPEFGASDSQVSRWLRAARERTDPATGRPILDDEGGSDDGER